MISREGGIACYQQLSVILHKQIEEGKFRPGKQLSTETELSRRYKINRHTIRQAIGRLQSEGLVYTIKDKGTFVANSKISYKVSRKTRFTTSVFDVGLSPDAKLLDSYEISAGRELSQKMKNKSSDKVVVLGILRLVNKIPFCHTTSFLGSDRFPDIQAHIKGSFSLYELLKKHYDVEATRTSSSFEVSMPDTSDMEVLIISPKVPLLVVKSISKDQHGTVVEYCITKFRGDICSVSVDFNGEGR